MDGELPPLRNYDGQVYALEDVIGQIVKDEDGEFIPRSYVNIKNEYMDIKGRKINKKGYLIDPQGNVIDKKGQRIFKKQHLVNGEVPKLFEFVTNEFNEDAITGEFLLDEREQPIKDEKGRINDIEGRKVNKMGYFVD